MRSDLTEELASGGMCSEPLARHQQTEPPTPTGLRYSYTHETEASVAWVGSPLMAVAVREAALTALAQAAERGVKLGPFDSVTICCGSWRDGRMVPFTGAHLDWRQYGQDHGKPEPTRDCTLIILGAEIIR